MLTQIYELSCNGPRCTNAYLPTPEELQSATAIRAGAVAAGWLCCEDKNKDLCDYCVADADWEA